jgi:hypothetical protein
LIALPHDPTHSTIYILLKSPPIPQTVDVQWHIFAQPKNSYFLVGNMVIFRWGQSIDRFREQQLSVTYVDKPKAKPTYSALTLNDNRVMADSEPLIYGFPDLDPVITTLMQDGQ